MSRGLPWLLASASLAAAIVLVVLLVTGDDAVEVAAADEIAYQEPMDPGPGAFTEPTDVQGRESVPVEPPSGGAQGQPSDGAFTRSNLVCDRDLLIRYVTEDPSRLRAWAQVLGIQPTPQAVSDYIGTLEPVTLTRDTRVTNHAYQDGRAVPFQSVMVAGTAVLVDKFGKIVVRCHCGNPLLEPVYKPDYKCPHCPPEYEPPKRNDPCYYPGRRPEPGDGTDTTSDTVQPPEEETLEGGTSTTSTTDDFPPGGRRCYDEYENPPPVEEEPEDLTDTTETVTDGVTAEILTETETIDGVQSIPDGAPPPPPPPPPP